MKIRYLAAGLLAACFMILPPQIGMAANEPQGDGTDASPYIIQSPAELLDLATRKYDKDLSKHYVLAENISLSGTRWTPIGDETVPFSGVFDGNGHSITGLSISGGNSKIIGLFGYNNGVIKKLQVTGTVSGTDSTGILAGFNTGEISQCWVTGSVSGSGYSVGALVGQSSGIITECASGNANVESNNAYAGGLIGLMSSGRMENCFSVANVNASGRSTFAGGLIGVLSGGNVRYTYAAGRLSTAAQNANGLIGRIDANGVVRDSYYDSDATGCNDSSGTALSTFQSQSVSSYKGWDFYGIWDIYLSINNNYPFLRNNPFLYETPVTDKVSSPTANPGAGNVAYGTKVTLSSSTAGAVIYYTTNGKAPSESSTKYTQPITVTENMTIKAIAVSPGYTNSEIAEYAYKIAATTRAGAPASNITSGTVSYGTILTLTSDIRGAVIYYTADGKTPTASSKKYTEPITLTSDVNIKAITVASGYADSNITDLSFKIRQNKTAAPVSNISSGTVTWGTNISLSTSTNGAKIYFTINGSNPTVSSSQYTGPITITQNTTIKAIAVSRDLPDSDIATFTYTLKQSDLTPYSMTISLQIGSKTYTKNGETAYFDVAPYIEPSSNRTMVPIRFIAEALGATVYWDNPTSTDYITLYDKTLSIVLNKQLPNNMGSSMLINDRLFVPIRYVSEQLGAKVDWDGATRTVIITK